MMRVSPRIRGPLTLLSCALVLTAITPRDADAQRARQGMLSLDDARLFYEVVGSGEPIVVIHGGPGLDHEYLQPGMDVLATRHTLVYYDQRGTGRSFASVEEGVISLDTFVSDIEALRQALGYPRISVLGHSFGALLAIEYAARYPDNLRALILMNPAEPGTRFAEETAQRRDRLFTADDSTDLARLRASEGFAARDAGTLEEVYRVMFRTTMRDPERVDELDLELAPATAKSGQDVAALLGASLGPVDWWDRLPEIQTPTLVLHGRFDIPPMEMSRALAEAFPVGTFQLLQSGHFPYIEDRDGLLSAISGFFAGLNR